MKKSFLLIIVLSLTVLVQAQQRFTSFSQDYDKTPEEMKEFLSTVSKDHQKDISALLEEFNIFWTTVADGEMQEQFITEANKMVHKKMRPYPHFYAYIKAYIAFANSAYSSSLEAWVKTVDYHATNTLSQYFTKMLLYENFFKNSVLNKGDNVQWVAHGYADSFGFDQEPYFDFTNIDLTTHSAKDSIEINDVSGRYYPASLKFNVTASTVYWDRAGLDVSVKAICNNPYTIDLRFPQMIAENSTFYYPDLFSAPVIGRVVNKATVPTTEEKTTYPRFISNEKTLVIEQLYPDVNYIGGFDLRGSSIYGTSQGDTLASVTIMREGKVIIRASSPSFLIKPSNLLSNDAKVCLYIEDDSLYHPAANFRYDNDKKELLVARPKEGVGRSPFFDSYHKLDITVESIHWNTNEERIEFRPLASKTGSTSAIFDSQNYYDESVMHDIAGVNTRNPLYTLWELFRSAGYEDITIEDAMQWFALPPVDVKDLMVDFAARGFIEFDVNNNHIRYRSKISQYLNNQIKKKDYDYIHLESKNHYAYLDLLTNDLKITSCEFFVLSDPQIVNVYPMNEEVVVKKNRDMVFSGRVIGGLFDFVAHNCEFNYDKFQVDMQVIDTMVMYVEDTTKTPDMYGDYPLVRVKSQIEDLSGILYIDVPGNKSGMIDYPDYSIFEARGGYVYYDKPSILGGVYTRDRFYYKLDAFRIVNLDNFKIDDMKFDGELVSGGIFPNIREPLKVRPDFSLGFRHKTSGLPTYGTKGSYAGIVDLSNRGLRGKGTIDYVTSHTQSDSIIFYLDSTNAAARHHIVDAQQGGTEFPDAYVDEAYMHWEPYQDQMFIYTRQNPITIFKETQLVGNTKITPSGMFGTGTQTFGRADITSQFFRYKHHELLADTADLRIYDISSGKDIAFSTDNYNSHVDFKTRKGVFKANGEDSEVSFVKNRFKAKAHEFEWDPIDSTKLRFKWDDPHKNIDIDNTPTRELVDMKSEGNELYASDPSKGYRFNAVSAEFDFTENVIYAHGVRYVNIGDAAIIPQHGDVVVRENAEIDPLSKSRILAGRENKYHELYNCNTRLRNVTRFYANGYYDYIDENKQIQTLYFDTLYYITGETFGQAKIPLEMNFQFSDRFGFDGRAELHSTQPFLSYFGGVEIRHGCDTLHHARMKILQQVNPENIMLQVHERTKDMDERKVVVAIASENKTGRIYTAFGCAKDQFNDAEYINVFGYITYNKEAHEYQAASRQKLEDPEFPGNIITLNTDNCVATGRGTVDIGAKLGRVELVTNGRVINYMTADSAEMHVTTSIDFFFNDESMKLMNKALENSSSLSFVDVSTDEDFDMALYNILGKNEYEKYTRNVAMGNERRLPEPLQVQFMFANLDFEWNPAKSTFMSQTTLPLIICGSKAVYKSIPGRIVVEKKGSKNRLYLYFEFDEQFYYFQFDNNVVFGFSSDKAFNDAIKSTKPNKRYLEPDNSANLPSFSYRLGNRSYKNKFVKNYFTNVEKEEDESDDSEREE